MVEIETPIEHIYNYKYARPRKHDVRKARKVCDLLISVKARRR